MTATRLRLRELEGTRVNVALADGSRLDGVLLVSAGRGRAATVWVFVNGEDVFVSRQRVVDVVATRDLIDKNRRRETGDDRRGRGW